MFDPTPEHPAGTDRSWTNFSNYTRPLSADEWTLFQNEERNYRKTLDTKRFEDRQSFAFSGEKPAKWIKLICILNGLYFKNGTFTTHHKDGKPFGLPFLKYTVRVLKKFPRHSPTPEIHRAPPSSLGEWIQAQLRFVRDVIQPALCALRARNGGEHQRMERQVGRNKLAYLWQYRKSKAIEIILNNSTYPAPPPAVNNVELVQNYYSAKCKELNHAPLDRAPCHQSLILDPPVHYPETTIFTESEVEKVITNLPNDKASGSDGVTYETIKATRQVSCQILTHIFNTCLLNGKVPDSWKGALIHRIPKKGNIPDYPSTWRDISLLPTIYKVFMKCVLARILPWLETGILSPDQKAYISRQGMNEHVFCLKTAIDDFKHDSAKLFTVFLDFRDAFGS